MDKNKKTEILKRIINVEIEKYAKEFSLSREDVKIELLSCFEAIVSKKTRISEGFYAKYFIK
ncbi:MAG: hypothetical protein ACOCRK_07295 [bacterium]